jgi:hypothetical protein
MHQGYLHPLSINLLWESDFQETQYALQPLTKVSNGGTYHHLCVLDEATRGCPDSALCAMKAASSAAF